jgi:arylsulfatase I/J
MLADDFGWADADWHRPANWTELATPNMMWLISQGAELGQHYAFKFCSPTRSAIQSGRNPIHVNVQNYQPVQWNWQEPDKDPDSGFAGISRNMTTISSVMKDAGYATHFAGKWDCGMATPDMTPHGRGYDTSLFYFHHDNDYWTEQVRASDHTHLCPGQQQQLVDLYENDGPARGLNNTIDCKSDRLPYPVGEDGKTTPAHCRFEDEVFLDFVVDTIHKHDMTKPLFLFWAAHSIHGPLQVPYSIHSLYTH